ncbi:MAG: lmo0937 family membrane protein [Flavobacterium sp.]
MQNLLYSIVILLLIFWALGFFIYNTGNVIHLLLLAAVVVILLKIIKGEKV